MKNLSQNNALNEKVGVITLRCNRCGKPIIPEAAILTPTGYRCKECVRGQQKKFDTTKTLDFPVAFIISAILSFLGSWLAARIGFFIILIAPAAGMLIAKAVRFAVSKRRSKTLFRVVLWATIIGSLPLLILPLLSFIYALRVGSFNVFALLPLLWQILFTSLSASTAYYHLSGIRLR